MFALLVVPATCVLNSAEAHGSQAAQRAAESINKIASYSVEFKAEFLTFAKTSDLPTTKPQIVLTEQIRDIFVFGFGRRVERNIDVDDHSIAVAIWRRESQSPARDMTHALPGLNYFDYFNPNCDGFFLLDLLMDKLSDIKVIEDISYLDEPAPGFELSHPKLKGLLRIWVSPKNAYMPVRIEKYIKTKQGRFALLQRTEIAEFTGAEDGVRVPIRGQVTTFIPSGPNGGTKVSGFSISVDVEKSGWNTIASNKPFMPESLPEHNWTSAGWNYYHPSDKLKALKANANDWAAATQQGSNDQRFWWIALNVLAVVLIAIIVLWKRSRSNTSPLL